MGGLSVLTIQLDLRVPWEFPEQLEENAWFECRKAIVSGFNSQMGMGSIPISTIFSGMNIHLPAILGFTRGTRVLTHPQMYIWR